ncbi:unnamed protein product, partial [Rotaria magnacalcarata]
KHHCKMDSNLFNNNSAVQYLLQQAEELVNSTLGSTSNISHVNNEYQATSNSFDN